MPAGGFGTREYLKANALGIWAIQNRADFLDMMKGNATALAGIYRRAGLNVAARVKALPYGASPLTYGVWKDLEKDLTLSAAQVGLSLHEKLSQDIGKAINYGTAGIQMPLAYGLNQAGAIEKGIITAGGLSRAFVGVNTLATTAQWSRTVGGLTLSERIWSVAGTFRNDLRDLINESVAAGLGPKETGRLIETLARKGGHQLKKTIIEDYPAALERMGRRSWPKATNWEALRLARTELSYAYNEGAVVAGRLTPGYIGSRWVLSDSHPEPDICDDYAGRDEDGLGRGVYRQGNEPVFAHPNCLCYIVPVFESREDFVKNIAKWVGGGKVPALDKWHKEVYKGKA